MEYAVALLVFLAVVVVFFGIWRLAPRRDDIGERMAGYMGPGEEEKAPKVVQRESKLTKRLGQSRMGTRFAAMLAQSDLPLTAGEFLLVMAGTGALGFLLGAWRIHVIVGVLFGAVGAYVPVMWAGRARTKRRRAIAGQLPDVLTLVVGALRAGYGLAQAIDVVATEGPQPSAKEFGRVLRATELGVALPKALDDMARRIGSDDIDLLVTAINVQYEVGGNLTAVLENISQTIRERIRILREIRTLTSQQRLTGTILAFLPVGLAVVVSLMQPGFFKPFFEPGLIRLLPIASVGMMLIAYFLIQRILDIEV